MATASHPIAHEPEYVWELATLYPPQGEWSEEEYLRLTDGTNRLIEFSDGHLEFLPMPTEGHQLLGRFLFLALYNFVEGLKLGEVHYSGLRVQIRRGKFREPDVLFLHRNHFQLRDGRVWNGADLVMEVVSGESKDRDRDYKEKLADYTLAKIAEYWIVDPDECVVIVHRLHEGRYVEHGEFFRGAHATSVLLPGFSIDVNQLFSVIDDKHG